MSTGVIIVPAGTDIHAMPAADLKAALYPLAATPVCGLDPRDYDVYPVGAAVRVPLLPLDGIAHLVAAAYSPARNIRTGNTKPLLQVRRSSDNAAADIGVATAVQTRTNLATVPTNNSSGFSTVTGISMTTLGSGTEFGMSYIDVRYFGTATAAGSLVYSHSPAGTFDPALQAPATPGVTYTGSLGYRLVAGTAPPGQAVIRTVWRSSAGTFVNVVALNVPAPSSILRRVAVTGVAPAGTAYSQPGMTFAVALNDVLDFTIRVYAPNIEEAVGNARPLLQRNTPEVVAAVGDLDAFALLAHCGTGDGFVPRYYDQGIFSHAVRRNLFTWSQDFGNAAWVKDQSGTGSVPVVTENAGIAPDGTLSADQIVFNLNGGTTTADISQVRQFVSPNAPNTLSIWLRTLSGTANLLIRTNSTTSIAAVTTAWTRFELPSAGSVDTATSFVLRGALGTSDTATVLAWGAQLELGSVATEYQPILATANMDLIQATASAQPAIVRSGAINTANQHPILRMDATNTFMDVAAPIGLGAVSIVLNSWDGATFGEFDGLFGGQTNANWTANGAASSIRGMNNSGSPRINGAVTAEFAPLANLKIAGTNTTVAAAEPTGWCLGRDRGNVNRTWNGDMGELVAFLGLPATPTLQRLERGLGLYNGITVV